MAMLKSSLTPQPLNKPMHLIDPLPVVKVGGISRDRRSVSSEYFKCVIPLLGAPFDRKGPLFMYKGPPKKI